MTPTSAESGKTFSVTVTLTDTFASSTYTISITVSTNLAPSFSPILSD